MRTREPPLPYAWRPRHPGYLHLLHWAPEPRPPARQGLPGLLPAPDPAALDRRVRRRPSPRDGAGDLLQLPPRPLRLPGWGRDPDGHHGEGRDPGRAARRDGLPQGRVREGRRPLRGARLPPSPPPLQLGPRCEPRRLRRPTRRPRSRGPGDQRRPQTRHRLLQPGLRPRGHGRARQGPRRSPEGLRDRRRTGPPTRRRGGAGKFGEELISTLPSAAFSTRRAFGKALALSSLLLADKRPE